MEKITFWQLGPGQNRNRGCDTIIQSNKTFSSRLFNAVEISGLIAFSKKRFEIRYDRQKVRTGKNKFTATIHATNIQPLLQATYCVKFPTLKTVFVTTSRTQKNLKIIHSTN